MAFPGLGVHRKSALDCPAGVSSPPVTMPPSMLARASQYAVIEFSTLLTPRQLNSPLRCSVVQAFVDNLQHALEAEGFSAPSAAGQPVVGLPGHDGSHSYKLPLCFTVDDVAKLAHGWHDGVFSSAEFRADWYCRGGSRALWFLVVGLPVHTDLEELRGMLASLATVDQVHVSPAYLDVGLPRRDAAHATMCFSTRGFPRVSCRSRMLLAASPAASA